MFEEESLYGLALVALIYKGNAIALLLKIITFH